MLSKPSLVVAFTFVVVCNISASQVGHINDNFWQGISEFMFQGECMVNLNNLFSKPSTPILLGQTHGKRSWEMIDWPWPSG